MEYFNIGDKVIVSGTMYPFYEEGERHWLRRPIKPRGAFYVGYTYKQEGAVFTDPETGITNLINIKSIKVLRVKFSDWGNDYFTLLQDVKRIKE